MAIVVRGPSGDYVERAWEGRTVVCLASGPSVTQRQIELTRGHTVLAINDNYLVAPWAEVLYFADHKWWVWHCTGIEKKWPWVQFSAEEVKKAFAEFKGQKVTIKHQPMAEGPDIFALRNDGAEGLCFKPDGIRTGMNSGYQSLNLAILAGAKKILLLGYDFNFPGGRSHAHNGHKDEKGIEHKMPESAYTNYAKQFASMMKDVRKLNVDIVNCNRDSALRQFRFGTLEEELK